MVCLETSFIIDILRGSEKARILKDRLEKNNSALFIPSPVVMELISGAHLSDRPDSEKEKIKQFLSYHYVVDFDMESAFIAGEIEATLTKKNDEIEPEDVMIAAIALQHHETLVTRNARHFEKIKGLEIEAY